MGILILILFIFEMFLFAFLDRMLFGTYITPTTILSIPYFLVVVLSIIIGPGFGFVPFYYPSLWIWIVGLPVFWLPGCFLATGILQKTNLYNYPFSVNINDKLDQLIYNLSYLAIFILLVALFKSLRKAKIGSELFELSFGSGISGHTLLVSKYFLIYLIARFKKMNLIPILFLLFFYFTYGVKSWIIIPILSGILIRVLLNQTKISFSLIVKIFILALIVFYVVYRIALGPSMPYSFVSLQFFRYLFAGVLGLSEYIKHHGEIGIDATMIINPIINIYYKITGSEVLNTTKNLLTYIGPDSTTNVKTFFGSIYIFAGPIWGIFLTFLFGTISYFFLSITIKTKNILLFIIYSTFLTLLFFGWFDTYSGNLFFYEFPAFGLLMFVICPYLLKIKILKNKILSN